MLVDYIGDPKFYRDRQYRNFLRQNHPNNRDTQSTAYSLRCRHRRYIETHLICNDLEMEPVSLLVV